MGLNSKQEIPWEGCSIIELGLINMISSSD